MNHYYFTSESVTEGHPDKVCDQISDAVLDAIIAKDPKCRVACETAISSDLVLIMGEISSNCYVDIPSIARRVIDDIGYSDVNSGFDIDSCKILTSFREQSTDIATCVSKSLEAQEGSSSEEDSCGAGDQGIIFGYACDETPELMPMPIVLAHKLAKRMSEVRKLKVMDYLRPDGKTQVTVEYIDDKPARVDTIIVSAQHSHSVDLEQLQIDILNHVVLPVIPTNMMDEQTKVLINPSGRFVVGGPAADSGLTGRKIIVDTYGGFARHGGGALSGKDPTKVDRCAAYAARYIAKNIVAAGLATRCEVQIAYAIGVAHPISVSVDAFGTSKFSNNELEKAINQVFDLRPAAIIKNLDLQKPIYQKLAAYGQIGRQDLDVKWERTDKIDELKHVLVYFDSQTWC